LAINAAGGDAVKPYPLGEDLLSPVPRVGMLWALRKGPAGRRQLAAGRGNSRDAEQYLNANRMSDSDRGLHVTRTAGSCKPSADPRADARDPHWTTQRAVGSSAFMAPYVPRRGRRRIETMPSQNHEVRP
jgi:hypothetical protein